MENYKKKYEEALERCKKEFNFNNLACSHEEIKQKLERVLPELKESEDERIRKEIIRIVNTWTNSSPVVNGIPSETLLAWLEKQSEPRLGMVQWRGDNLKEVVEFTGKSPKFGEWFKTWEEYENYVHSHGDIFKLFDEMGNHYEVPVGAWIVKTPDGYNVASKATYVKKLSSHQSCFIIDNKLLNEVIECLKYLNYWVCGGNDTIIGKLEHLKSQSCEKPSNEKKSAWSEEDECIFDDIIMSLKGNFKSDKSMINWLKSIKERMKGE